MMAKTVQTTLDDTRRVGEPTVGDFSQIYGRDNQHLRLTECPLCALDPQRDRVPFSTNDKPQLHFLNEHDADDVGRPMSELSSNWTQKPGQRRANAER